MQVKIKDLKVAMAVGNQGVEFDVSDTPSKGEKHLGDLYVQKKGLVWCNGKTTLKKGKSIKWDDFIEWANGLK